MIINGKYQIVKKVGEGAMAKVYLARDLKTNRPVAMKQIAPSPEMFDIQKTIKRFEREYQFLSSINHPNIIRAYDFFRYNNSFFMVLEYVPGMTLEHVFKTLARPDLKRLVNISLHLAYGVEVINMAGILHRDLKPGNIIINKQGIKILDLGIGKHMSIDVTRLSEQGSFIGTIDYASPDQFNGEINANSDVFSLAVILYQLFTWQPYSPFLEHDIPSTLTKIVNIPLPKLSSAIPQDIYQENPAFFDDFSLLLDHALQKDAQHRIASSMDFVAKLETITKCHIYHQISPQEVYHSLSRTARDKLKQLGARHGQSLPQATQKKQQQPMRNRKKRPPKNNIMMWVSICVIIILIAIGSLLYFQL